MEDQQAVRNTPRMQLGYVPTVAETSKDCPQCNSVMQLFNELGVYWWYWCPNCCCEVDADDADLERDFHHSDEPVDSEVEG